MAKKTKSISRSKLIKSIASEAGVSKSAARKAYDCIAEYGSIHRKQKVKKVPTIKEVVVKVKGKPSIKGINVKKAVPVVKRETRIKKVDVIKEKIVEKPIEIIKEVEVIKEVPVIVEKEVIKKVQVIKEVPVRVFKDINHVVEVTNDKSKKELINRIRFLESTLDRSERDSKKAKKKARKLRKKVKAMKRHASSYLDNAREVEVIKTFDVNRLKEMINQIQPVQISKKVIGETRKVKEGRIVSRREIKSNGTIQQRY